MSHYDTKVALRARIICRLADYELDSAQEFYAVADKFFTKRLKRFEANTASVKSSSEEAIDAAVDQRELLREHLRMSANFGVQLVFAAWEQFLQQIYELTRYISTVPQLRDKKFSIDKKWLRTEEYLDYFKQLGLDTSSLSPALRDIEKLKDYRNAITHQSGQVTEENVNKLRNYSKSHGDGYKVGDTLEITAAYVHQSIKTVRGTMRALTKQYLELLKALGIGI